MSATAAREVAFEVVRRTFGEGAFTDRAFRGEADRAGLAGRDRALAQRLAYLRRRTFDGDLVASISKVCQEACDVECDHNSCQQHL